MKLEFETQSASLPMVDPSHLEEFAHEGSSTESDEMLRKGIEAAQSGDRSEARAYLLGVTDRDPDNESAWLWLASISEYPEELLVFLNNVLRIDPSNERALEWAASTKSLLARNFVGRGSDAAENEDLKFAKQCFMQAIVHDDHNESAWLWLASLSESEHEKKSFLSRVLRIDPHNESAKAQMDEFRAREIKSRLMDANRLAIAGGREEAVALLSELLDEDPTLEDAWMLKAHLAESFGEKISCFEHVLDLNEDNQVARANLESLSMIVNSAPEADDRDESEAPVSEMYSEETVSFRTNGEYGPDDSEVTDEPYAEEFSVDEAVAESAEFESVEVDSEADDHQPEEAAFVSDEVDFVTDDPVEFEEGPEVSEPDFGYVEDEEAGDFLELSEDGENDPEPIAQPESAVSFETAEISFEAVEESFEPREETVEESDADTRDFVPVETDEFLGSEPLAAAEECPYCGSEIGHQGFVCQSCNSVLTLSDLEMLLSGSDVDTEVLEGAVARMESEQGVRGIEPGELFSLGIAYINLKQYRKGYEFLQEYAAKNPNDVVVSSQVDALAVRVAEIEQQDSVKGAQPTAKTILVVDDSPTIRKLISLKLQKCGHETICAVDGVDALDKINDVVPDLVLLDITMPRMDGYQVCKLIRGNEATKNVPVVMISGKDGFFDKVRGKMVGTSDYITKPFGPETLMRTVNEYLM